MEDKLKSTKYSDDEGNIIYIGDRIYFNSGSWDPGQIGTVTYEEGNIMLIWENGCKQRLDDVMEEKEDDFMWMEIRKLNPISKE